MADIELSISTDKVCFIAAKAREFEVKDLVTVADLRPLKRPEIHGAFIEVGDPSDRVEFE
jgi:hypothetical protein